MSKYNHFHRVDEAVIDPPFLVVAPHKIGRDENSGRYYLYIDPRPVVQRHVARMAGKGIIIDEPKQERPLNGMCAVGLAFDQQEALRAALCGEYAQTYWGQRRAELEARFPQLKKALAAFWGEETDLSPVEIQRISRDVISRLQGEINGLANQGQVPDLLLYAPDFLYRAWQLRQRVVAERRAMSLIPVASGDTQGDTPSFTPVLKRIDETTWRMGWPGDPTQVSPKEFNGSIEEVLPQVLSTYSDWYNRDQGRQERQLKERAEKLPDHLFIPVWAHQLRQEHSLDFGPEGQVRLINISHGKLFQVDLPDGLCFQIKSSPIEAVRLACAGGNGNGPLVPPPPTPEQIEAAYLELLGGQVNLAASEPQPGQLTPLSKDKPQATHTLTVDGQVITVAWLEGHPRAKAVVSGSSQPARAVLAIDQAGSKLGIAPFSFSTRAPDLQDMWRTSPIAGLNLADEASRRALSAWLAWVWQDRSALKKYQPGGAK